MSESPGNITYPLNKDDIPEEHLQVLGEVFDDDNGSDDDSIPVRVLEDFIIFKCDSRALVPIEALAALPLLVDYAASGEVRPHEIDDEYELDDLGEDDDTESLSSLQRVELSKILEMNIHHYDSETGLDP